MDKAEIKKKLEEMQEENNLASLKQNQTRARSFTVGTSTGGIIELGMRGDFASLWYLLQPVEAVEIINQLAAAAGLEVATRPRQDYASWRGWDTSLPPSVHWMGTAPWQLSEEDRALLSEAKQNKKLMEGKDNVEKVED